MRVVPDHFSIIQKVSINKICTVAVGPHSRWVKSQLIRALSKIFYLLRIRDRLAVDDDMMAADRFSNSLQMERLPFSLPEPD